MLVKVKICGIRREEDIDIVNKHCPDFIGLIFYPGSKRYIKPEIAVYITKALKPAIKRVGVFVNEDAHIVNKISELCSLDVVQLHGNESAEYCSMIKKTYWTAFQLKDSKPPDNLELYMDAQAWLFDAYSPNAYGGTGKTFDWNILKNLPHKKNIVVAGGLNRDNVLTAIENVSPWCVDVSSGVETDGCKDEKKVGELIKRIRNNEVI